jgi:HEAT repeat protein
MLGGSVAELRDMKDLNVLGRTVEADVVALMKPATAIRLREAAAITLGRIFPDPTHAVAAFQTLYESQLVTDRRAAIAGVAQLSRRLDVPQTNTGPRQIERAYLIDTVKASVPLAGRALSDTDSEVRRDACEAIQRAAQAVMRNINTVDDAQAAPDLLRKEYAAFLPLLQTIKEQMGLLSNVLTDADVNSRLGASEALEKVADMRNALTRLVDAKSKTRMMPDPLREVLAAAGPGLGKQLDHADVRVRLGALYALESLEAEAIPAMNALVKASKDGDPFVRWGVARVLGQIAPAEAERAVPALSLLLADDNGDVQLSAVEALRTYGPAAKQAVQSLTRLAEGKNRDLRVLAIEVLAAIGPDAEPANPQLIAALDAKEEDVRVAAATALGKIGVSAPPVVERLVKALDDSSGRVRTAASDALLSLK